MADALSAGTTDAPLRLTVGLPPAWRRLRWLLQLTLAQALLVAVLAGLPVFGFRYRWEGATLVLRPDGSAELAHGTDALEGVSGRRAWLFSGLAVIELHRDGAGAKRLVISSAHNRRDDWRRLRGWIRLGRLGVTEEPR